MVQKQYKLLKHHGWLDFFDTNRSDFISQLIQFIRITLLLPVAFKISGIDPWIPKFIGRNDWLPYSPRHDLIENFWLKLKVAWDNSKISRSVLLTLIGGALNVSEVLNLLEFLSSYGQKTDKKLKTNQKLLIRRSLLFSVLFVLHSIIKNPFRI